MSTNGHDPSLRVMSLHALAYCQRLFYLEEVEEIRVADDRVYAGRELHASLEADEEGERDPARAGRPRARARRQGRRAPAPGRVALALRAQARPLPARRHGPRPGRPTGFRSSPMPP